MILRREWPLGQVSTDEKKTAFEPPMNTDEHRLKADKEKRTKSKDAVVFIMFLSVFIGAHRWLEDAFCDFLNLAISVCSFAGVCDASVS
jgi:hypothetical protein